MAYQIEKEIKCPLASRDENISKRNIHWRRPPVGFVTINTDGSYKNGYSACGGLIRYHCGHFVKGFLRNLGTGNALLAELCGILFGCQMARDMRLTHVILETDSTHVVNMINNRFTSIFYLQPLLHEVISLIHLPGWTIHVNHIHREANSCFDALAFKGHDVGFTHVMLDSIPAYISTLLDKDLRGACSSIAVS
ncbi:hypothetical protein TSUD_361660 [Trifolium subterraneum]|uniref:RNase H type-1 domain-containing protein n=1 Tax=Trifolium subterraneum TaxID=3900 RepID=A0A2Z6M8Z6_TRISU|nr:hypothetical protein TSUD_361660 [Trifolium subterraneum]